MSRSKGAFGALEQLNKSSMGIHKSNFLTSQGFKTTHPKLLMNKTFNSTWGVSLYEFMNLWLELRVKNPHEGLQQSTLYCEKPGPNNERDMPTTKG